STKTMIVSRGGRGAEGGRIVSLEAMANLPSFGYSQTRAADHPFSIWDRSVFWRKGKWFFFLDRVTVREAGAYSVACSWNTRGSVRLASGAAEVSQGEGEAHSVMHLKNAKARRFDSRGGIHETVLREMVKGARVDFSNLLYASGGPAEMEYEVVEVSPSLFAITGDEDAYLGVTEEGLFQRAGMTVRGNAFCLSPVALSVVAGRELRWHELTVMTSVPCGIEFEPRSGQITVETDRTVQVTIGRNARTWEAGTHTFSAAAASAEQIAALTAAIRTDAGAARKASVSKVAQPKPLPALPVAWSRKVGVYASYCLGDVNGDGIDEIVLGMSDGRVVCLSDAGDTLWEHKLAGEIRAVACAALPGGVAVIAGSKNQHVYALSADGAKVLWRHKLHFSKAVHDSAPWWTEGGKATTKGILVEDLDGDGAVEIICGTGATFVEALTPAGKTKWLRQFLYGQPNQFGIAPTADGTKSLLVNAGQASGCCTWRLAPDGKVLSRNAFPSGRGSWDGTRTRQIVVADLDGKGMQMALVGRGGAFNELGLFNAVTGKQKWQHRMADQISAVVAFDTDGDGVKEIIAGSVSAWLCAFDLAGKPIWAESMPAAVQAVTAVGDTLYVQCADACVYRVSSMGKLIGKHRVEGGNAPTVTQPWRLLHKRGRLFVPDRNGWVTILTVGDH
ncbi:MAG: PQQ-binding-like beta-propeller repeat protein, partial [Lentisphaeria bacterium]|nr:PQQ-binding-like beta-propeller repeat protein [Lentisphaeria bacterium]